ncbi:MAG: hypothetical protein AB1742_09020 [bacterium]
MTGAKYAHVEPGKEVESIGGRYVVQKETTVKYNGRDVLVVFGCALIDRSCCGAGGVRYALVPGYVLSLKTETAPDGSPVSSVEPVEDERDREALRETIERLEPYCQVNFM